MVDHHRQGIHADMVIIDEVFQIGHDRLAVHLPVARHLLADAPGNGFVAEQIRREVQRHAERDGRFTAADINDALLSNRRYLELAGIHPQTADRWIREGRPQTPRMNARDYIVAAGNPDDLFWTHRTPHTPAGRVAAGGVIPAHRGNYATTRVNMPDGGGWVNIQMPAAPVRIEIADNVRVQLDENVRPQPRLERLMATPPPWEAEPFDDADRALADIARRNRERAQAVRERAQAKQKEIEMEMQSCACGQRHDDDGDLNQAWEHGPDECTYVERSVDQYVDHGA